MLPARVHTSGDFATFFDAEQARLLKALYFVTGNREEAADSLGASNLTLSPDGRTIVFSSDHDGSAEIGTVGVDGTGLRWLTTQTFNCIAPAWSPDGSRIAFVAGFGTPQGQEVHVVNPDGSNLRKLTSDAGSDQWPSWSPDGKTIAYSNSGRTPLDDSGFSHTQELWTVPADGGTPTRLTHNDMWDDMPVYSPSGRLIVFDRQGSIWTMAADGSNPHPLRGLPGDSGFNPRWSPDGSKIAFLSYDGDRSASDAPLLSVHVLDLSTGTSTVVPGKVETDANAPSWLPSSDALLVNRYSG
ncbi:MAG: hypothetical protein M3Q23_08175 [Actinomycetota bacterium]|nr:hypothetical protein [Actinomycetota bacterium]